MKDFIIFTEKEININKCFELLSLVNNSIVKYDNQISIESKNPLLFDYYGERILDPKDDFSEEFQNNIPIENAFISHIESYRTIDVKRVIKTLLEEYNNMYIYIDDINWYGSAVDFLNTDFGF